MRYSYRPSTKPSEIQENARRVAMDAFLAGRMAEGETMLKVERTRLSKPQAKQVAKQLARDGRHDDALKVLMMSMGESQAKKELEPTPTATVGDILVASWGYDQTNIDFYEVTEVSGSSATIRKIGKNFLPSQSSQYRDAVMPARGAFVGPPKKKRVQKGYGAAYSVKANGHHASLWNGQAEFQTASGYGH